MPMRSHQTSINSIALSEEGEELGTYDLPQDWFVNQQKRDGSWFLYLLKRAGYKCHGFWIALVISRMLKRFFG